jgi:hypothetical protein
MLRPREEEVQGRVHEDAVVPHRVLREGLQERPRHQLGVPRLRDGVLEELEEILPRCLLEAEPGPEAASQGDQLLIAQEVLEPPVPGDHDRQEEGGVEVGARDDAKLGEDFDGSLLRIVNQEDRPGEARLQVGLPLLPERLEAAPAVMRC